MVPDLEVWRRERFELFDQYEPALTAFQWESADRVARVLVEDGRWSVTWGDVTALHETFEAAIEACDVRCRQTACTLAAQVALLLRGLDVR